MARWAGMEAYAGTPRRRVHPATVLHRLLSDHCPGMHHYTHMFQIGHHLTKPRGGPWAGSSLRNLRTEYYGRDPWQCVMQNARRDVVGLKDTGEKVRYIESTLYRVFTQLPSFYVSRSVEKVRCTRRYLEVKLRYKETRLYVT